MPGGRRKNEETGRQTALRELEEETGLHPLIESLIEIYREDRVTHNFFAFEVTLTSFQDCKSTGDEEEEEVKIFALEEIQQMRNKILQGHWDILQSKGLLS